MDSYTSVRWLSGDPGNPVLSATKCPRKNGKKWWLQEFYLSIRNTHWNNRSCSIVCTVPHLFFFCTALKVQTWLNMPANCIIDLKPRDLEKSAVYGHQENFVTTLQHFTLHSRSIQSILILKYWGELQTCLMKNRSEVALTESSMHRLSTSVLRSKQFGNF